jgi:peroxiredoxin
MTDLVPLFPRQKTPALQVALVAGGSFDLFAERPRNFTLVTFYRGLHCPICRGYLGDLHSKLAQFEERGVSTVAISSDNAERAERARSEWRLPDLRIGYGLDLAAARRWGLYVSRSRGTTSAGIEEPALFSEPGLFLVRPGGELYFGTVQTMPFARPHFADILGAIDFVLAKSYPGRGEIVDLDEARAA